MFFHCTNVFASCLYVLVYNLEKLKDWDYKEIITFIIGAIAIIIFFVSIVMIIQQIYLISNGMTTNECIRRKYSPTLFDEGCIQNWKNIFHCRNNSYSEKSKVEVLISNCPPSEERANNNDKAEENNDHQIN